MKEITSDMIKILRERTGVGMGKCKEALVCPWVTWKRRLITCEKPGWLLG